VVTGNGLVLSEDMARRFLTVELDAGVEDPEARDFAGDLLAEVEARRGELLADVLTIWRWGRRLGTALPAGRALGSFEQWGRWCRDPLLALGCRDPVLRVAEAKADDPRRRAVAAIFVAWWEHHGDRPVTVAGLHDAVREAADPAGRGRQYLAARVRGLEGTRAAGFVLDRMPAEGRWSPDAYRLARTDAPGVAAPVGATAHGGHRDHGEATGEVADGGGGARQVGPASAADPDAPYDPYASASDGAEGMAEVRSHAPLARHGDAWLGGIAEVVRAALADGAEREADPEGWLVLVRPDGRRSLTAPRVVTELDAAGLLPSLPDALQAVEAAVCARPPSWAEVEDAPRPGDRCRCGGRRWWTEATEPRGWRCRTCHPPDHLGPRAVTELVS
jgi:hypothetical protein